MDIVSKFTIASEEGLHNLAMLKEAQIRGMYSGSVEADDLEKYINQQLDEKNAVNDLNNLSTQMVTVFAENKPVGYAIMKHSVNRPDALVDQKAINYNAFYVMPEYDHTEIKQSLWNKCLSVTNKYDAIWIEVYQNDPIIPFLESCGFQMHAQSKIEPFGKDSHILIRTRI